MAEYLLAQPQVKINFSAAQLLADSQLVVAGGRQPEVSWLQAAAAGKKVYCADRGIEVCLAAGVTVAELYGDGDSGSAGAYVDASAQGTLVYRFPPAKDDTDLQLVLQNLPRHNLLCTGVWGGRFDHLYSNIFSLFSYKLKQQVQVCLADEKEILIILNAGEQVELELQQQAVALSLLPLTNTTVVSMSKVRWPLEQETLTMLHPYAISNIPQKKCSCSCTEGAVGLYLSFAE